MEIFGDRIGAILKYGKVMGRPTKRFFYIDNEGILHYSEEESLIKDILKSENKSQKAIVELIKPQCKQVKLNDCSLSSIKPYPEKDFDLHNRSYFEVFVKSREFRSLQLFAYKEDYTDSLYEFISSFKESFAEANEERSTTSTRKGSIDPESLSANISNLDESSYFKMNAGNNIFKKEEKYMDDVLVKLDSKFVNQINWQKECIRIVNPSSDKESYIEELAQMENGSTYSGEVKNGMPHGLGKEFRQDGALYSGSFYQGKWHGLGTLTTENLDSYSGEYIDGCICGI